jgi:predicted MFS family arabinose efflux permease
MLLAFAMWALVWTGVVQPWHIVVISALGGMVMAFDMPSRQSFMMEMTSRDDLMNAISLNSSIVNGARIVGPALAGLLMAQVGMAFCFFINGVSFIAVIAGLVMMRLPAHVRPVHAETPLNQALSGFRHVRQNFRVFVLMLLFGIVGIFGWSYAVLMPAFARDILGVGEKGYGVLMAASGVGALIAALLLATAGHRFPRRVLVFGGIWLFAGMLALFAFNRNYYLALLLLAGASFGMIFFFSTSNTLIQTSVPDEMRGRVMGVWSLIFGAMVPLGSLEAGTLAHVAGISNTIAFGAAVCAAAAGVTLCIVRRRAASIA